ncbi:MAG TPA: hypothetical protein VL137_12025, partial [Polyangiaceae bacterium]|nr:hypothetical protein [Polyangiaceae bacterium]
MTPLSAPRLLRWLPLALVLALALVVFGPSLGFEFVEWDDPTFLTQNPLVIDAPHQSALDELLTPNLGYPIPFTVLTYRVENALFGVSNAAPYHFTNVLLHLLGIGLLYAVARRLKLSPVASAFAAAVFGLHPAVAESVSWVTGRKDLLMTAATLGALWLILVPQPNPAVPAKPSRAVLASSALLCVIALLSKPTGACAALVAGVVLAARVGGKSGRLLALKTY